MVSSGQVGLAGIRTSAYVDEGAVNAVGALHPEWKSGIVCGFTRRCPNDRADSSPRSRTSTPNAELPAIRKWVVTHIRPSTTRPRSVGVERRRNAEPEEMSAADARNRRGGAGLRGTVLLNDMVDWKYTHDRVAAAKPRASPNRRSAPGSGAARVEPASTRAARHSNV